MSDPVLSSLATAVADGERVDWDAASARLNDRDRAVARHLQSLSAIADATHAHVPRPDRSLPAVLGVARLLAIVVATSGAAGEVLGWISGKSQYAIFLSVLVSFGVAATFLDIGGRDRRARALSACYWAIACSFSLRGTEWLSHLRPTSTTLLVLAALRPEAFFAAGLWQFTREFPSLSRFGPLDRWCTFAMRASSVLGVVLFVANLLPTLAPTWRLTVYAEPLQRYTPRYGPWFWGLLLAAAVAALVTMAWRARTETIPDATRARLFLYVIACTLGPVAIEVIAEAMFPAYQTLVQTQWRWWASWIIYPSQIALPLFTAYAVLVDNVLDVRIVVQQGLRYLLARSLVMWGAALPIGVLVVFLLRHRDLALITALALPGATALTWASVVAAALLAVRSRLVLALDRRILPGLEEPSAMLAGLTAQLKQTRTPIEIASVTVEAIERALQAPAATYLVYEDRLAPIDPSDAPPLENDSFIAALLANAGEPCIVEPNGRHTYFALLPESDRSWIVAQRICVLLPLSARRKDARLLAAVAIKARRNALSFSEENLRFLRAASAAATLACDALDADAMPQSPVSAEREELAMQCLRCGTVVAWSASLQPCSCQGAWQPAALPKTLARRFDLTRRLGAGGMGVVYEATDTTLGRPVALKTLTRLGETAAARLLVEARTMARFSDPQIAVLYGTEMWQHTPVLVMEFLGGGTLAERLARKHFSAGDALRVTIVLASALDRIHAVGLFHGDIKPSNIAFTKDDLPKFLDFGLARATRDMASLHDASHDEVNNGRRIIAGTLAYLSPHVRRGGAPGPELDVWALCLVLCEMLLGCHPCPSAATAGELSASIDAGLASLKDVSADLRLFLRRALQTDGQDTTLTAKDIVKALVVIGGAGPS